MISEAGSDCPTQSPPKAQPASKSEQALVWEGFAHLCGRWFDHHPWENCFLMSIWDFFVCNFCSVPLILSLCTSKMSLALLFL